jgi:hypothetical protein
MNYPALISDLHSLGFASVEYTAKDKQVIGIKNSNIAVSVSLDGKGNPYAISIVQKNL